MNDKKSVKQINKEDRDLVSLAVKCKFINTDQEKKILSVLTSSLNDPSALSLTNLFKGLKILSQSEIDFLFSIDKHLKNKCLDIKFGKLAVANQFTTPVVINNALEQQINHFKKTKKHLAIGDLLVGKKQLSETDRTAILLTQNRIKDELLEEAMNTLATSELEKIAIKKRFGSIAVKNGYVSIKDINQAIKIQNEQKAKGHKPKYLGEILEKQFGLTQEDILKILKEQQVLEKRRLSLEKALFKYISEVKINQKISKLFEFTVSNDNFEAHLLFSSDFSEEIHAHSIINWIKLMGLQFGIVDISIIEKFLAEGSKGSKLKIAQGNAPQKGESATIKFFFDHSGKKVNDKHKKGPRQLIRKGKVLAQKTLHKDGVSGKNVFGQTIPPQRLDKGDLRCGRGVASRDNLTFVAKIDGYPVLSNNNTLFVIPLSNQRKTLTISDDITHKEDSYRMIDLEINGEIRKGGSIACHDLKLRGDVFGDIDADGDLEIDGKISAININKDKNEKTPIIRVQGSLSISRSVENAKVICGRIFQGPKTDIISSEVCAQYGIYCKNVYSNGSQPSILKFGNITNHRVLEIRLAIKRRAKALSVLKREPELCELNDRLLHQIQIQDKYRERQRVLAYSMNLLGNFNLENMDTSETGFDFWESVKKSESGDEPVGEISKKTKAYTYLQEIMDQIGSQRPDTQLKTIQKLSEENHGMHKAAAVSTKKLEKEFLIKADFIHKEVAMNKSKIDKMEKELSTLCIEEDYLLSQETMHSTGKVPEIKIKNQISKGTIIIGKSTKLELERTIYGVRIYERLDPKTNQPAIEITGYFE